MTFAYRGRIGFATLKALKRTHAHPRAHTRACMGTHGARMGTHGACMETHGEAWGRTENALAEELELYAATTAR